MAGSYWVYMMMSSNESAIYTGVTNDLLRRVEEHRTGKGSDFTSKYKVKKLVYAEHFTEVEQAILREHRIKAWKREWKLRLIETTNPHYEDIVTRYV